MGQFKRYRRKTGPREAETDSRSMSMGGGGAPVSPRYKTRYDGSKCLSYLESVALKDFEQTSHSRRILTISQCIRNKNLGDPTG